MIGLVRSKVYATSGLPKHLTFAQANEGCPDIDEASVSTRKSLRTEARKVVTVVVDHACGLIVEISVVADCVSALKRFAVSTL